MRAQCSGIVRDARGNTATEYLLIAALVGIAGLGAYGLLGGAVGESAQCAASRIGRADGSGCGGGAADDGTSGSTASSDSAAGGGDEALTEEAINRDGSDAMHAALEGSAESGSSATVAAIASNPDDGDRQVIVDPHFCTSDSECGSGRACASGICAEATPGEPVPAIVDPQPTEARNCDWLDVGCHVANAGDFARSVVEGAVGAAEWGLAAGGDISELGRWLGADPNLTEGRSCDWLDVGCHLATVGDFGRGVVEGFVGMGAWSVGAAGALVSGAGNAVVDAGRSVGIDLPGIADIVGGLAERAIWMLPGIGDSLAYVTGKSDDLFQFRLGMGEGLIDFGVSTVRGVVDLGGWVLGQGGNFIHDPIGYVGGAVNGTLDAIVHWDRTLGAAGDVLGGLVKMVGDGIHTVAVGDPREAGHIVGNVGGQVLLTVATGAAINVVRGAGAAGTAAKALTSASAAETAAATTTAVRTTATGTVVTEEMIAAWRAAGAAFVTKPWGGILEGGMRVPNAAVMSRVEQAVANLPELDALERAGATIAVVNTERAGVLVSPLIYGANGSTTVTIYLPRATIGSFTTATDAEIRAAVQQAAQRLLDHP